MKLLTFEDGEIRLGGEAVPGLLASLKVDGKVRFDSQKVDGASGKSKTPQGWEDCEVQVTVALLTDEESDCYTKAAALEALFRSPDKKANPQIFTITNKHVLARGVRQVVFSKLETAESNRTDDITATLGFTEHRPPVVKVEESQAKSPTPGEAAKQKAGKDSPEDSGYVISGDLKK
ncbi:conserved hypothetical protein [uncultured Desulfovibrio sp.]|uniref:Uncharacterized protein n=1 Tax=uncultured Desulfovibrio sp. TaxID=167968 RepID=A0A212K6H3_9BACT|nr:hypothetical protein [uncultured Desulfovibrio sp.]SBW07329.1 conserved hypothetical protein [uncultured Desulfovibrio sp.]